MTHWEKTAQNTKTLKMYSTSNNSIYDIFFNAIYMFSFYTNIFYLLLFCLRAWTMFIAKHRGAFQPKIRWVYDFPVRIQITTSDWEYLKCITLQLHIQFSFPIECLRQEQGNNLCRYYFCEFIHHHSGNADDGGVSKINLLIIHHFYPFCIFNRLMYYINLFANYRGL
jgi:hypothetical protein